MRPSFITRRWLSAGRCALIEITTAHCTLQGTGYGCQHVRPQVARMEVLYGREMQSERLDCAIGVLQEGNVAMLQYG